MKKITFDFTTEEKDILLNLTKDIQNIESGLDKFEWRMLRDLIKTASHGSYSGADFNKFKSSILSKTERVLD